ncbi:MAG TPA: DUF6599 family protein [Pyrinomonadaceae bacterium]|nr:DUF6599 family protein [Pyrinomonadaceae bacterium]
MRTKLYRRLRAILPLLALLAFASSISASSPDWDQIAKAFPESLGTYRRVTAPRLDDQNPDSVGFSATADYSAPGAGRITVNVRWAELDGRAYEMLSAAARSLRDKTPVAIGSNIGTAGFASPDIVAFFKGANFVQLSKANARTNSNDLQSLATQLAEKLDRGEGETPVLLKHLPNWEQAHQTAVYLNRFSSLESIAKDGVLSAVKSEGDADAVLASYDPMRLLIIEFNTPQRSVENDQRIVARIQELWKLGQPAPSAYKRVGNYSVFVFDAPNDQAAKQLIDQVHYEQVVSWLGENPNILKEAQKHYVQTTLGVLVAVLKASGFALIACFGTGALIGALLFTRRRAQQRAVEAFSDAGGMLRLNLDEMTPQTNPTRLLGPNSST